MNQILHKGVDISDWQTSVDYEALKANGYDTVIIKCGGAYSTLNGDVQDRLLDMHYKNSRANGFKTGFYFFVYWNASPRVQAEEFLKFIRGKTSDTRFFLDIEGATERYGSDYCSSLDILAQEIIEEMKNICKEEGLILNDDSFGIYCPGSFAVQMPVSTQKYGLWIADPNIGHLPQYDNIPRATVGGQSVEFNNWIGWQWNTTGINGALGSNSLDVDVFKDSAYLNTPVIIGSTSGVIGTTGHITKPAYTVGEYVKLAPNTLKFAPNKIANKDKGVKYKIKNTSEDLYELAPINQYVTENEITLISTPQPIINTPNNNTGSPAWNDLSLLTKTAIFIGSNEGFSPGSYPSGGAIGYSTSQYQQFMQGMSIPISPLDGIKIVERWLEPNISQWNSYIEAGGLQLDQLSDDQKIALYDFGYNTGGGDNLLYELCQCIATRQDTYANTFGSFCAVSNPADQQGIDNRRRTEYTMYFDKLTFGGAISQLPDEYYNIVKNL